MGPATSHRRALRVIESAAEAWPVQGLTRTDRRYCVITWWRWCRQDRPTVPAPTYAPRTDPKERTR